MTGTHHTEGTLESVHCIVTYSNEKRTCLGAGEACTAKLPKHYGKAHSPLKERVVAENCEMTFALVTTGLVNPGATKFEVVNSW